MRVLVFGATGSIGFPVSQALARAGHTVYGLTRSKDNAKHLLLHEVIPIIGELDSSIWHTFVPSIDAIVDAKSGAQAHLTSHILSTALSLRPASLSTKLIYIHTSGTLAYGDTDSIDEYVSEDSSALDPGDKRKVVAQIHGPGAGSPWNLDSDDLFLQSKDKGKDERLIGVVIRPGLAYGGPKSSLSSLFNDALTHRRVMWPRKKATQVGIGLGFRQRYNAVHVDDLADLYVRTVERAHLVQGRVVLGVADQGSIDDFLGVLAGIIHAPEGVQYYDARNAVEETFASTQITRPYVGRVLLGWQPVKPGLVESIRALLLAHIAGSNNLAYDEILEELLEGYYHSK